ncbi:MAG: hypothetical protein KC635_03165 [Myxococcales bacterium]|nr:hypothetical protein [Myxococcales bacterium]
MRLAGLAGMAAAALLVGGSVEARAATAHVGVDVGVGTAAGDALDGSVVITAVPGFSFLLGPGSVFGEVPFAGAAGDEAGFRLGNPVLGYGVTLKDNLRFAPAVALPVATARRDGNVARDLTLLSNAAAMDGWHAIWRWLPDDLAIVLPLSNQTPLGNGGVLQTQLVLTTTIPTAGDGAEVDVILELGTRLLAPLGERVGVGLGFSEVLFVTSGREGDLSQAALEPSFLWIIAPGSSLVVRLVMNLDAPNGFAFDSDKVWGAHVGLTVAL